MRTRILLLLVYYPGDNDASVILATLQGKLIFFFLAPDLPSIVLRKRLLWLVLLLLLPVAMSTPSQHGCFLLSLFLLLSSSLLLNLYFLFPSIQLLTVSSKFNPQPGWSKKATTEAEAVAAVSCSGHGRAYLDGIPTIDGPMPSCECNNCYSGDDCSEFDMDCIADVDSGNPMFLEPYWKQHASASAVLISGWHRMSYLTTGDNYISLELEKHIRLLHSYANNAVTDDKFIAFGVGSTQLINALVHAMSPDPSPTTTTAASTSVLASVPYYPMYETQTKYFDSRAYSWRGITSDWMNLSGSSTTDVIEFVTSPNNPEAKLKMPVLNGSSVINDHAYYWPHFTAIPAPVDEDVMLFTISKVSGHAGSRFGWTLIRNQTIHERVSEYLRMNSFGVSHETHLRMLTIIKAIIAQKRGGKDDIFVFGRETLTKRWKQLNDIVSATKRFSLQSIGPDHCTYFNITRDPSPAYGWLKCEMEEDVDCSEVLLNEGKIISRSGTNFGESTRYTRLSLLKSDDDFQLLSWRLKSLVLSNLWSSNKK